MYTIDEIKTANACIHEMVVDTDDLGSRQRMFAVTEIYLHMLATSCETVDRETLGPAVQKLIDHFIA